MTENTPDRLDNLVVGEGVRVLNPAYSKLVRWLRLVLPLVAVIIVVMLLRGRCWTVTLLWLKNLTMGT
ncbi:MAG: hypothetical protein LRY62_04950 [Alphaproteobacteria bacterium]|nr:hypothetical protein [Alphaproteobacteria bacterium]